MTPPGFVRDHAKEILSQLDLEGEANLSQLATWIDEDDIPGEPPCGDPLCRSHGKRSGAWRAHCALTLAAVRRLVQQGLVIVESAPGMVTVYMLADSRNP